MSLNGLTGAERNKNAAAGKLNITNLKYNTYLNNNM